jgi:hypothetical protein
MSLLKVLCGSTAANVLWGSNALGRPKTQNLEFWRGSCFYDTTMCLMYVDNACV